MTCFTVRILLYENYSSKFSFYGSRGGLKTLNCAGIREGMYQYPHS